MGVSPTKNQVEIVFHYKDKKFRQERMPRHKKKMQKKRSFQVGIEFIFDMFIAWNINLSLKQRLGEDL